MKAIFALLIAIMLCFVIPFEGLKTPQKAVVCTEKPTVNPPVALRQINWLGSKNQGSCCWASAVTSLNWEGQYEKAQWIRSHYANGEYPETLAAKLNDAGIRYAMTVGDGDVAFLEKALASRRPIMVAVHNGKHCVVLAYMDTTSVCLIDCNKPSQNIWLTRDEFLTDWLRSGSLAIVPLYSPVPPLAY